MKATFLGYDISTDSYLTLRGLSNPRIISYPRTIGVILEETGVTEASLLLKSYIIGANDNRSKLETFMHELNEILGTYGSQITGPNGIDLGYGGDLVVSGNTYHNAYCKTGTFKPEPIMNNRSEYTLEFILGDQNTSSSINQLDCSAMRGFTRGRKMTFQTTLEDGSVRTFNFWHNCDAVKNLESYIVLKRSFSYGGHARVIKTGGYEKIICDCWLADDDCPRQAIEAYFYNAINGPLGRLGTLIMDPGGPNSWTVQNAFFQEVTMQDTPRSALRYQLTFLASLQC